MGITVTDNNKTDKETSNQIQISCVSFVKLSIRLRNLSDIKLWSKCNVYKAMGLPGFLFSTETYTVHREHIRKLEAVQNRHLRQIMKTKRDDHGSNVEMRQREPE